MDYAVNLVGRILLAGFGKIAAYAATQGYMAAMGVPGALLPLVILLEVGGGLALIAGVQTRIAASLLAVFSIVAAVIFHRHFADQMQSIMFMKNLAMAGGLLLLAAHGAGAPSWDHRKSKAS
ncbi:MAG TPA: DoxX family protein [Betaproteobacteria bacterium]|nr:DoxX family protein [Betaproteobacteria bacterium]